MGDPPGKGSNTPDQGDQRFAARFKDADFEIDEESEQFQKLKPMLSYREKKLKRQQPEVDEEEEEVWMVTLRGRMIRWTLSCP